MLLDAKRKSIEPMAARLARGDPAADADADADALEQALQQFVNQSPWDWVPVRRRLAERMTAAIRPAAWVIDDTGFPKFGRYSVGVAPQSCGALGKVANCQVGVSVHAATDGASCPLDWRLFLPPQWDDDAERRRKAHVPQGERHRPKWQLALELLDELTDWELLPPVLLADVAYGEVNQFRLGLEPKTHRSPSPSGRSCNSGSRRWPTPPRTHLLRRRADRNAEEGRARNDHDSGTRADDLPLVPQWRMYRGCMLPVRPNALLQRARPIAAMGIRMLIAPPRRRQGHFSVFA